MLDGVYLIAKLRVIAFLLLSFSAAQHRISLVFAFYHSLIHFT